MVLRTAVLVLSLAAAMQPAESVRTIEKGAQSNIDSARQAVARNDAELAALWKSHNYDKPAPKVDFSREIVVAVFMGSRPTAGFSVEILSAAERGGQMVVTYREKAPPADALTAQVLTSPYHIAAIAKTEKPVVFTSSSR